jgi:UDP-glucose 4-epimerase
VNGEATGCVLVTGAAGYVGSHVARACLAAGHDVVVLDDGSTGHVEALRRVAAGPGPGRLRAHLRGAVGDEALVRAAVRDFGVTACIHLAGSARVGESVAQPLRYYQNNLAQGLTLLEALLGGGVRRFVFSSSAAVYGEPEVVPIPEDHPLRPVSPYGETKAYFEAALARCAGAHDLRFFALRYFNAAGAHPAGDLGEDHRPETHVIPLAIDAAMGLSRSLTIFGDDYPTPDGTAVRDYVHVCDLADAHVRALRALAAGTGDGCVNLGSERGHSVRDVVQAVAAVAGRPVPCEAGGRRAGDPPVLVASNRKARALLGWQPRHADLAAIVRTALTWRRAHPRGYPEPGQEAAAGA